MKGSTLISASAALSPEQARALLDWYAASGVETAEAMEGLGVSDWQARTPAPMPQQRSAPKAPPLPPRDSQQAAPPPPAHEGPEISTDEAVRAATEAANGADSLGALDAAIRAFPHCPLKAGARSTVISDGIYGAPLLVIGEAPGVDEDKSGKPFVGRAGQLLDKMLKAIGHSRVAEDGLADTLITNSIYWRPPGNRTPTPAEVAVCLPFLVRFVRLAQPKAIILTGNVATQSLFPGTPGITRARGKRLEWQPEGQEPIPAIPMFHPAFLLRSPAQKRLAWADLLQVAALLDA